MTLSELARERGLLALELLHRRVDVDQARRYASPEAVVRLNEIVDELSRQLAALDRELERLGSGRLISRGGA